MTEIQLRKESGALRPESEDAFRVLSKVKNGQIVVADIKDPSRRSTAQHNFWFAIANTLYESQEYFKDFDTYRKCLLVKLGYCDVFKFSDGTLVPLAHSLKFGSMTDDEFQRLVEGTLDFAESVGFDRDVLLSQTRERVGWAA